MTKSRSKSAPAHRESTAKPESQAAHAFKVKVHGIDEAPDAAESATGKLIYDRLSYILVVDDDDTLLKFFKIHLNKFFSRVIVVRNAKEAVETLTSKDIDLVVTDVRMPRVDGFQLMRRVRRHDAAIPVLIVSGALLSPEQQQAADDDSDGYLRKPFNVQELHEFLDRGMALRGNYKRLAELLPSNKVLRDVLRGKVKVDRQVPKAALAEAREILARVGQMTQTKVSTSA